MLVITGKLHLFQFIQRYFIQNVRITNSIPVSLLKNRADVMLKTLKSDISANMSIAEKGYTEKLENFKEEAIHLQKKSFKSENIR